MGECLDAVCVDCARGSEGCTCLMNGTCDAGLACAGDRCAPCTPGSDGCTCGAGESCDDGLVCTDQGMCAADPCPAGMTGCPCTDGTTCADGDYCADTALCRTCNPDVAGCPCAGDGTCEADLYCLDEACAACPDTDRPATCGCETNLDCAPELACDPDTHVCRAPLTCIDLCLLHQVCDDALAGDPICVPETCEDGFVWDGAACVDATRPSCDGRAGTIDIRSDCASEGKTCVETTTGAVCVLTCEALSPTCATDHRDCDPNAEDVDATCGACQPGYAASGTSCVANPQANCVPEALDSILDVCTGRLQECVTLAEGAMCGACLSGTELDSTGNACLPSALCGDGICGELEFCYYPQIGGPPACAARQCGANQAYDEGSGSCMACALDCGAEGVWPETVDGACACASDVYCDYQYNGAGARCHTPTCAAGEASSPGGQCITCPISCGDAEGESTRLWPLTTADGSCICETLPGYYYPLGGSNTPERCDEDQDGWLNRTAFETVSIAEPATAANFRCELRKVDRFILRNEYGQEHPVSLCNGDLVDYEDGAEPPCGQDVTVIALFEPDVLDNDRRIQVDDTQFPTYGAAGRKLHAAELNPLTRACVGLTGDFNQNGRDDVSEDQPLTRNRINGLTFTSDADFVFQSLAYFTELHRGHYRAASSAGLPGRYVIEERSRCDDAFPVSYLSGGDYWRGCTRNRRGTFDAAAASLSGMDFAAWSCDDATGTCPLPNPAVGALYADADADRVEDHDLCQLSGDLRDQPWRGMNHHSQFQCVVLKAAPAQAWELDRGQIYDGPGEGTAWAFNTCQASSCEGSADPSCAESARVAPLQPESPTISCTPTLRSATNPDQVGFVAARFLADGAGSSVRPTYLRGCVDESYWQGSDGGYKVLCPGYEANPMAVFAAGNAGDFGKLICSCNTFYGGANCEVACPERALAAGVGTALHTGGPGLAYDDATRALYGCDPDWGYCQLHQPDPSINFEGGRLGFWACGEVTATVPVQGNDPALRSEGPTSTWSMEGKVRLVPVRRQLLEEPACDPAVSNCWSAF